MKTSELTGALLDYWVARAENHKVEMLFGRCVIQHAEYHDEVQYVHFSPSALWEHSGPSIEKYKFVLSPTVGTRYICRKAGDISESFGDTPLQAICRAVVRAAFGDEVEDIQP